MGGGGALRLAAEFAVDGIGDAEATGPHGGGRVGSHEHGAPPGFRRAAAQAAAAGP